MLIRRQRDKRHVQWRKVLRCTGCERTQFLQRNWVRAPSFSPPPHGQFYNSAASLQSWFHCSAIRHCIPHSLHSKAFLAFVLRSCTVAQLAKVRWVRPHPVFREKLGAPHPVFWTNHLRTMYIYRCQLWQKSEHFGGLRLYKYKYNRKFRRFAQLLVKSWAKFLRFAQMRANMKQGRMSHFQK